MDVQYNQGDKQKIFMKYVTKQAGAKQATVVGESDARSSRTRFRPYIEFFKCFRYGKTKNSPFYTDKSGRYVTQRPSEKKALTRTRDFKVTKPEDVFMHLLMLYNPWKKKKEGIDTWIGGDTGYETYQDLAEERLGRDKIKELTEDLLVVLDHGNIYNNPANEDIQWTEDQKRVIDEAKERLLSLEGCRMLVNGAAGTGKSPVLEEMFRIAKNEGFEPIRLAPSGVAAAIFPYKRGLDDLPNDANGSFQEATGSSGHGLQYCLWVKMLGDFGQLGPINKAVDITDWWWKSDEYRCSHRMDLLQACRQSEDPGFKSMLDDIRRRVSTETIEIYDASKSIPCDAVYLYLYERNIEEVNRRRLQIRADKTRMTARTGKSKDRLWVELINSSRKGAIYFLELENVLLAQPAGYFESRDMDASNQKVIVKEWKEWMATFRCSKFRVLVGLARKQHKPAEAATKYLLNKVLVARKLDMMETSKAQLRNNETEMTQFAEECRQVTLGTFAIVITQGRATEEDEQDAGSFASSLQDMANENAQAPASLDLLELPAAGTVASTASSSSSTATTMDLPELSAAGTVASAASSSSSTATTNVIDEDERVELLAHIEQASHTDCEWKIYGICVACSFQCYQRACVKALVEKKIKKSDIADVMAVLGIFAPFLLTERMISSIGRVMLEELVIPMTLPELVLDDATIMRAVRLWINNNQEEAAETLLGLDMQTRNMIETLLQRLPMKQDRSISESTFVANYVSPVLHGTLKLNSRIFSVHFPNTNSEVQKHQGMKPDRPDIVVKARSREIMYGEVTGLCQEHNDSKNKWDLFRLARFGKAFLDDGFEVAPLVQLRYVLLLYWEELYIVYSTINRKPIPLHRPT
ncbi:hypothetical protein EDD11_000746 [Mortierella claussenii]|nr:hypothetical protein EDD11_000746 [Mortierella claussenii]